MPLCERCGKSNPRKMIGLMTLWFGPFVELRPGHGYFYLCPACYRAYVLPHLEQVQGKLQELHPLAARHLAADGRVLPDEPDDVDCALASAGDAAEDPTEDPPRKRSDTQVA